MKVELKKLYKRKVQSFFNQSEQEQNHQDVWQHHVACMLSPADDGFRFFQKPHRKISFNIKQTDMSFYFSSFVELYA